MDDFDDLDFDALDALEASHLASKQNRSSVNSAACFPPAAARQGCVSISVVAAQPSPSHDGTPQLDASCATAFLSAAEAPKQGIPHNVLLPVPPVQKHHQQHQQPQHTFAQTSMQSYIAAHSARGHLQQPVSVTLGSSASVPHSLHQLQQQAIMATGVLADAEDLCIDLTSQPDGTAAADAQAVGGENAMQLAPLRPAAAVSAPAEASIRTQEAQAVEEGTSEDELMECSTNLLNPGIRVHKSNARHWVYPASVPERAYQIDIISTALLQNTLVCLPTGLGKTLIAAVIMHNFTRWFPEGKVVFVAPTKPLVNQQIEACYEFMGVSKTSIEELTGSCKRLDRQDLWERTYKRIFFCTPQTFRNDVDRGICPHKKIVCLVVDECHRAKGNSDVVLAVKKLREEKCKFRVLGLSATPGSNNESIQEVIDNLMISAIQYRSETDPDIQPHVHQRCVDERVVQPTREVDYCKQTLIHVLQDVLTSLARMQAYYGHVNAHTCQRFTFLQASDKYKDRPNKNPLAGMVFRQAMVLTDVRDQLDSYGIDTALKYLDGKLTENAIKRLLGENTMFNEVNEVQPGQVVVTDAPTNTKKNVEFGTCIWTTGIKMHPLVGKLAKTLPQGAQEHWKSLKTDQFLQVQGTGGTILAMGDAATVAQDTALNHAERLFAQGDTNGDGVLNCEEVIALMLKARKQFPMLAEFAARMNCGGADVASTSSFMREMMHSQTRGSYDNVIATQTFGDEDEEEEVVSNEPVASTSGDAGTEQPAMTLEQFKEQLKELEKGLRSLPATAQVAAQQGKYLAQILKDNPLVLQPGPNGPTIRGISPNANPFNYVHLGSLAYIGADKAVMDPAYKDGQVGALKGWLMGFAWKGVETFMQISVKNMYLVSRDLIKTKVFGRDVSDV